MEQVDQYKPQYPLFLKMLLAVGAMFLGSLGLMLLSMILGMLGFAYGLGDLVAATVIIEQAGIVMLGLSIVVGGALSVVGMTARSLTPAQATNHQQEKAKNENRVYDIREDGLTVEDVLDDMSMRERGLLAEKLAESRLAIREDGTLIPLEQAEKLYKVERFIDGQ